MELKLDKCSDSVLMKRQKNRKINYPESDGKPMGESDIHGYPLKAGHPVKSRS